MPTRWADALARAYEETGQAAPAPPDPTFSLVGTPPPFDRADWGIREWRDGGLLSDERAWLDANYEYHHVTAEGTLLRVFEHLGIAVDADGFDPADGKIVGYAFFHNTNGATRRWYGPINNWILYEDTSIELWWKP